MRGNRLGVGLSKGTIVTVIALLFGWGIHQSEELDLNESPLLRTQVDQGLLPSLEERLPTDPATVKPHEEIGQYGGTWRRVHMGMPDEAGWMRLTYDPLLRWSRDYKKPIPNTAKSWEVSEDGKQFTFHLRKGMKWSDGHPFTSRDYMFWYNEIILNDDLFPVKPNWLRLEGELGVLDAPDDHTIRFSFSKSNGVILQWLASWTELVAGPPPSHYLKQYHPNFVNEDSLNAIVRIEGYDTWMALYEMKSNPFLIREVCA